MTYVRVDDMEADEFFYRYKDEIKAIRSELGAVLHKRLADDKRGGKLQFLLSLYGLQETLSALIATFIDNPEAQKGICAMLPKMVMSDIQDMLQDQQSGLH